MRFKYFVLTAATLALASTAFAETKVDDAIKFRQGAYRFMAWNMSRIDTALKGDFNKEEVLTAANTVQAIANSGLGKLFVPGSDKGTGFHETHAKAAIFDPANGKKVLELAGNFKKEADDLAKVAATGDKEAVKVQFGKLGKACKACHEDFRKEDR